MSEIMDRKILEKRMKEEKEELVWKKFIEERKAKKEQEEKKNMQRKKEKEIEKKKASKEDVKLPSNVKELPESVRSIRPDSYEYCVPGNGACALNCLAAWIYLDHSEGPLLGWDLNTHMAEYREYYKEKLN